VKKTAPTETISCAFCGGKGRDPYDVLSPLSRCEACKGEGKVTVFVPHVRCSYCRGTGSHKTFRCLVCSGTGVVPAPTGATRTCPSCRGYGAEIPSGMVCLRCNGRGVLLVDKQEIDTLR